MGWITATTDDGRVYYYETSTGATSWTSPVEDAPQSSAQQQPQQPQQMRAPARQALEIEEAVGERASGEERSTVDGNDLTAVITGKIDTMLTGCPCGFRCFCATLMGAVRRQTGKTNRVCGCVRHFFGALLYGILFVPFVYALLQQAAMDRVAVDPFAAQGMPSRRAWQAGFIYLGSVTAFCVLAFSILPPEYYEPGSARLTFLLFVVVFTIWIQQALTVRYVSLRPELSVLQKNRSKKHQLCGRAYSTLNPRNIKNYIYLSVVVAEFFLFASTCFHSKMPWMSNGATADNQPLMNWLQTVLPEALAGNIDSLVDFAKILMELVLLGVVALYLFLLGDLVYARRSPNSIIAVIACEFLPGTCYTTVVGRLMLIANSLDPAHRFSRVIGTVCIFLFATTGAFVATMRHDVRAKPKETDADIRFKPKCALRRAPTAVAPSHVAERDARAPMPCCQPHTRSSRAHRTHTYARTLPDDVARSTALHHRWTAAAAARASRHPTASHPPRASRGAG